MFVDIKFTNIAGQRADFKDLLLSHVAIFFKITKQRFFTVGAERR
jgi:hypothetical protein